MKLKKSTNLRKKLRKYSQIKKRGLKMYRFFCTFYFLFLFGKFWVKYFTISLFGLHCLLILGHSVLHLTIYFLHLDLLDVNNILDFPCITSEHVFFPLAIILCFLSVLFDEIACTNFNKNVVDIVHNSWDVERRCKWYHDFFSLSVIFEINKNLFAFFELSDTHLQCLITLSQLI